MRLQDQAHGLLIDTMLQQDSAPAAVESKATQQGLVGGQTMAFQLGDDNDAGMNEMNLIPLIDIMLVLMIIFLVTATVANPSIPLTLPKTTADIVDPPPKTITVSINANGEVAWDNQGLAWKNYKRVLMEAGELELPTVQLQLVQIKNLVTIWSHK